MTNTTLRPLGHALLLPLAASLAAGCVAEDHVLGERTETVVSTTGGTALSADGLVRLDFPAGALGEQTLIVIETLRGTGRTGLLSEVYDLRPNGLTFDKPVTIRFEVDSSEPVAIANVDEATPSLLESTYDSVTGRVEAELAHFSSYSVVPAYDPCAGKVCGDACDVCPPNSSCVPPSYATACNPGNQCVRDVPQLCGPAPAALSVFPAALDFGMVQVGASSTLSFKVRNSGGLPGMLTGTSLVPSGAPFTTPSLPSVVPAGVRSRPPSTSHPWPWRPRPRRWPSRTPTGRSSCTSLGSAPRSRRRRRPRRSSSSHPRAQTSSTSWTSHPRWQTSARR